MTEIRLVQLINFLQDWSIPYVCFILMINCCCLTFWARKHFSNHAVMWYKIIMCFGQLCDLHFSTSKLTIFSLLHVRNTYSMLWHELDFKGAFFWENPNPDSWIRKGILHFITKIQRWIINPENPHFEWILQIKSKCWFLRFIIRAFFFWGGGGGGGKDPKKVHLTSGLPCKYACLAIFLLAWQNLSWKRKLRWLFPSYNWTVFFRSPEWNITSWR